MKLSIILSCLLLFLSHHFELPRLCTHSLLQYIKRRMHRFDFVKRMRQTVDFFLSKYFLNFVIFSDLLFIPYGLIFVNDHQEPIFTPTHLLPYSSFFLLQLLYSQPRLFFNSLKLIVISRIHYVVLLLISPNLRLDYLLVTHMLISAVMLIKSYTNIDYVQ